MRQVFRPEVATPIIAGGAPSQSFSSFIEIFSGVGPLAAGPIGSMV